MSKNEMRAVYPKFSFLVLIFVIHTHTHQNGNKIHGRLLEDIFEE